MNREYYVYVLQDSTKKLPKPDKNGLRFSPFYVGKGVGNRSLIHTYNAEKHNFSHNFRLLKEIKDIRSKGGSIIVSHIFKSNNEDAVYEMEKSTILFYGLKHKGGILVNAGSGIAGGWGAELNPTYNRMTLGTHNFQTSNPQLYSPKLLELSRLIKLVDKEVDIKEQDWVNKTSYASSKALKIGILRVLSREKLPYVLKGSILKKTN
jgi:hypothetical protein